MLLPTRMMANLGARPAELADQRSQVVLQKSLTLSCKRTLNSSFVWANFLLTSVQCITSLMQQASGLTLNAHCMPRIEQNQFCAQPTKKSAQQGIGFVDQSKL